MRDAGSQGVVRALAGVMVEGMPPSPAPLDFCLRRNNERGGQER